MANITRMPFQLHQVDNIVLFDDFLTDQTDLDWIDTVTDTGTALVSDARGGIMALVPSDGTVADNDETYLESSVELFKLAHGKPLNFECYVQFTEANTDDANIAVGLMDAPGANTLVDDGAGLETDFDGFAVYKVDGGTVWKFVTSRGTTQTISTSTTTAGGATYQKINVIVSDFDSTQCQVVAQVNGEYLRDSNGAIIRHYLAYASNTEITPFFGVKNGGANLETLNIDYVCVNQVR